MKPAVNFAEPVSGDVRVNLGGADAGVAHQFLNDSQVGTVFEQVCGEAVPKHVRGHIAGDPNPSDPLLNPQPKSDCGKWRASPGEENIGR